MLDSNILQNNLSKIDHLSFKCQTCNVGTKVFDRDKYFEAESAFSRNEFRRHINGIHTNIHKRFSAGLTSTNPDCKDISIVLGDCNSLIRFVTIDYEGQTIEAHIYDVKIIIYDIIPTLHLFDLGRFSFKNPDSSIIKELEDAFDVFWQSNDCSGMKIRSFLEALMDDNNIPKKTIGKAGKEVEIKLHLRIELFVKQFIKHDLEDILKNLKDFGNFASHSGQSLPREGLILMIKLLSLF